MKPITPQRQFKGGYVPQQHVMPHSMENREADSPSGRRVRDNLALGFETAARPGLAGMQGRRTPRGR